MTVDEVITNKSSFSTLQAPSKSDSLILRVYLRKMQVCKRGEASRLVSFNCVVQSEPLFGCAYESAKPDSKPFRGLSSEHDLILQQRGRKKHYTKQASGL